MVIIQFVNLDINLVFKSTEIRILFFFFSRTTIGDAQSLIDSLLNISLGSNLFNSFSIASFNAYLVSFVKTSTFLTFNDTFNL